MLLAACPRPELRDLASIVPLFQSARGLITRLTISWGEMLDCKRWLFRSLHSQWKMAHRFESNPNRIR